MRTVLGVYTRTFWFDSTRDLLSRWISSGTTCALQWFCLERFHQFPYKREAYPFGTGTVPLGTVPLGTVLVETGPLYVGFDAILVDNSFDKLY